MTRNFDDIVITGAGLVSSLGLNRETTWNAIKAGRCGIGPLSAVESPLDPDKGGGQVVDPDEQSTTTSMPREVRLLRRAICEAMSDAGIEFTGGQVSLPCKPSRCAILLGTTLHGMRNGGAFLRSGDPQRLKDFPAGATLRGATADLPPLGFTTTTCSACSSGLASVSLGHTLLQSGETDLVIAGGYDPISEYAYAGFNAMRLVSPTSLRPFATTRDGMKVAEGYAIVVLERASDAAKRGATPLAMIAGYGESCDAHHLSKPHPEGAGAAAAMRAALTTADLKPSDIDMLIAHATATPDNDASEFRAMSQVFGEHLKNTPVVGLKRHLGHSLGAAGTVDLILAALAIRDGVVPLPKDFNENDLEYEALREGLQEPTDRKLQHVLSTSLGFGGANACMIVAAPQLTTTKKANTTVAARAKEAPSAAPHDVVITGVGAVLPGAIGANALAKLVTTDAPHAIHELSGPIPAEQYEHLLNARRTRRMSGCAKLCLAATADAYANAGITDIPGFGETCAAIVGSTHGAAAFCHTYYRQIIDEGVNAANPILFAEGVPNVASAHLTTTFSMKGFCQTLIGTRTAGLEALQLAAARIRAGVWTRAIVCATDDHLEIVSRVYQGMLQDSAFIDGSGAVTLILESRASAESRGATIRGRLTKTISRSTAGCTPRDATKLAGDSVTELGPLDGIALSGTHAAIDRIGGLGVRLAHRRFSQLTEMTTLYGRLPELYAVGPLAALAAMVAARSLPATTGVGFPKNKNGVGVPSRNQPFRRGGVLCGDFRGGFCGAAVTLE